MYQTIGEKDKMHEIEAFETTIANFVNTQAINLTQNPQYQKLMAQAHKVQAPTASQEEFGPTPTETKPEVKQNPMRFTRMVNPNQ